MKIIFQIFSRLFQLFFQFSRFSRWIGHPEPSIAYSYEFKLTYTQFACKEKHLSFSVVETPMFYFSLHRCTLPCSWVRLCRLVRHKVWSFLAVRFAVAFVLFATTTLNEVYQHTSGFEVLACSFDANFNCVTSLH